MRTSLCFALDIYSLIMPFENINMTLRSFFKSLIKALAERTGRSIVNVSLARISTNVELASIFFYQKYYVEGENIPVTLGFKDIIS